MDSGLIVDASDDVNWKRKCRWTEKSIVYTRRTHKKARKTISNDTATTTTKSAAAAENPTTTPSPTKVSSPAVAYTAPVEASTASTASVDVVPDSLETLSAKNTHKTVGELQSPPQTEAQHLKNNSPHKRNDVAQISSEPSPLPVENGLPNRPSNVNNGSAEPLVISKVDDRVRFKLAKATKRDEIKFLSEKLVSELDQVSSLVKQLEQAKQLHLASYNSQVSNSNLSNNNNNNSSSTVFPRVNLEKMGPTMLARANSDLGSTRIEPRPFSRQLSVAVMENSYVEKEKRTPKANQYYRNSEFLLGKDRLPPENVKRSKTSKGRKRGFGSGFNKSCSSLLQRLMKHKNGWVFNNPVDVNSLGLVDYHDIIKHPMDLGTIKTCLSKNRYKSPTEFADDVRLVFRNAMTYNPKGHEVHVMAEELLQIFEDRWATMESEYNYRKATQQSHFSVPIPLYAPASAHLRTASSMAVDSKVQRPHVVRAPVPKKPKARDENKRDMTYDEKQRLSANLQNLPPEKLDAVVQIIKRRNTELSQNNDEIEVDIDNVDTETLWELDRFLTNYKKSLSKNRRKAELAVQAREAASQTVALANTNTAGADERVDSGTALGKKNVPPADEGEKQGYNGRSSSSGSSSSDSGSSSSDSDSDSSSANASDAVQSPELLKDMIKGK
ncbi:hypothetical protein CASFOL_002292 [Castilleja foliolosa]|uniref:Transcription factor GTE4-like n=1 Tax=Castilleja foliolosa TaxID=1961234 RepID=A0ABD3EE25_9LAMI